MACACCVIVTSKKTEYDDNIIEVQYIRWFGICHREGDIGKIQVLAGAVLSVGSYS